MPPTDVIKSYLVRLGFDVDGAQVYKFEATLQRAGVAAERMVRNMTGDFIKGGTAIVGALAGIATGTIAMMEHVSQADLGYKLFARRMFMTEDAAKKLKIATDALGYSLEEIIWGPPELAERYRNLIRDQERLLKSLGGADFDRQMRRLRDIRFEFTEIGVSVKYLGMDIVRHLARTILGDDDTVRDKIRGWNEWLMNSLDKIASRIATDLAPLVRSLGELIGSIFTQEHLDAMLKWFDKLTQGLTMTIGLVNQLLHGSKDPTAAAGGLWDKSKGFTSNMNTLVPGLFGKTETSTPKSDMTAYGASQMTKEAWQKYAFQMAQKYGIDPQIFANVIQTESSWNPRAKNPESGALGFGQFMPGNLNMYGGDARDPFQNLDMSAHYLSDLLKKHHGDWPATLKEYGGFVKKDPSEYINNILPSEGGRGYKNPDATFQPQSFRMDVGGITVHVASTNASAQEIAEVVARTLKAETQRNIAQFQGAFA